MKKLEEGMKSMENNNFKNKVEKELDMDILYSYGGVDGKIEELSICKKCGCVVVKTKGESDNLTCPVCDKTSEARVFIKKEDIEEDKALKGHIALFAAIGEDTDELSNVEGSVKNADEQALLDYIFR